VIVLWYQDRGQRPNRTETIREDANAVSTLPPSFDVVGVTHGRRIDGETVDQRQFGLRVEPPSGNISQDAIDAISTAFEDRWGGSVEFVESVDK
jgi:uncharacterized protein (UPF0218 family)